MIKVTESIVQLQPYVRGRSIDEVQREFGLTEVIKLASNENPLGPSPKAIEAMKSALDDSHRYPDGSYFELRENLSKFYDIASANLTVGNGSNELIDLLIRIFCEPGDSILITQAAFVAYKVCAQGLRIGVTEVPLNADLSVSVDAIIRAWTPRHKIIFLPNPNNPTGLYVPASDVEKLLERFGNSSDAMIVMDEAYVEYVRASDFPRSVELLKKYENLIVLRTLAKAYGLAGMRLGVMMADTPVIDVVDRVRNPFNVNSIVAKGAIAALSDKDYVARSQKIVWQGLDYLYQEFEKLGLSYCRSQGNFVFFDVKRDSQTVFAELLKRGIILRPVRNYGFPNHMRMTVGLPPENEKAIKCLKEIL